MQMVLVAFEDSLDAALKGRDTVLWCTRCCVKKCDELEFQGLNKEIRTVYYHVMHSNNCFYGESDAEGSEYQVSLRTRPSYFDQAAAVTPEKSQCNDESCTWLKYRICTGKILTLSVTGLRVTSTSSQFRNNPGSYSPCSCHLQILLLIKPCCCTFHMQQAVCSSAEREWYSHEQVIQVSFYPVQKQKPKAAQQREEANCFWQETTFCI